MGHTRLRPVCHRGLEKVTVARTLHLDYETRSEVNLNKAGMHVYAAHPSTRILMLSWAFDDEPFRLWEPHKCAIPPAELVQGFLDPDVICEAANAPFERLITYYCLGISVPYERWRCVLVKAYYLGFAGSLDDVLQQTGLRRKDPRGKQLINRFCTPAAKNHKADWYDWRTHPREWSEFGEYCITDGEVERALSHWLDQFPQMHGWDWQQWFIDQRINDRGVPVDVDMARSAIQLWDLERERLTDELCRHTGLPKVTRGPFLEHINAHLSSSQHFTSLGKDVITSRRTHGKLPEYVDRALSLWGEKEAKAATKYAAVLNCASTDGRARGMFQYKGASRTDRVGGRRLQLQNLKRPVAKTPEEIDGIVGLIKRGDTGSLRQQFDMGVSDLLGGSVRHVIAAPPGKTLTVCDWTSIESVIVGWLTNCELINRTFREGRDSYKTFGVEYYGVPYDQITKAQRTFCKPPVLGCSYQLGWRGLIAYAEGMGVLMSEQEAQAAVDTFRGMYPEIKQFWRWLYEAIKTVVQTGVTIAGYRLRIERDADFMRICLPSGRNLSYYQPEIIQQPAPWDQAQLIDNFSYMGMDDKRQWIRCTAHAGGVTENIIQSIASDVLWMGITRARNDGLDVILHVHDEPVLESHEGQAQADFDRLHFHMTQPPVWAPDLWLGADGFITQRYTKD